LNSERAGLQIKMNDGSFEIIIISFPEIDEKSEKS